MKLRGDVLSGKYMQKEEFQSSYLLRDLPVVYSNRVFLRPHHIMAWYYFLDITFSNGELARESRYMRWACRNHVINAREARSRLLANIDIPIQTATEIEYLGFVASSDPERLSDEDRRKLETAVFSPRMFSQLAKEEFSAYHAIYSLPEAKTIVVMMHVLDLVCRLKSEKGYLHCRTENRGHDSLFLRGAASLVNAQMFSKADKETILVKRNPRDPEVIDAVFLPLVFFKLKEIVMYIWNQARECEEREG